MAPLIISFLIFFTPLIEGGTTYLPVTVTRLFVIGALLSWFWGPLKDGEPRISRSGLGPALALFLLAAVLSFILAPYAYLAAQRLVSIISYACILYLLLHALNKKNIRAALGAAVLMGLFEAGLGIVQAALPGMPRAKGTFFNPDFFGGYLAMTAPLALCVAFDDKSGRIARAASLVSAVLMAVAVALSQSRGAFLSLGASCLVYLWLKFRWRGLAVALSLVAVMFVSTPSLKARFLSGTQADPYSYYRLHIWGNAVERVAARPWGEGLGAYRLGSQTKNFPVPAGPVRYSKLAESAHDGYLEVAVEMGVIGLAFLMWGVIRLTLFSARAVRDLGHGGYAMGCAAGLAAFFCHALVDTNFLEPALVVLAALLAAVIIKVALLKGDAPGDLIYPVRPRPLLKYGAAVLALLMGVYVTLPCIGWFYYDSFTAGKEKGCTDASVGNLRRAVSFAPGNASYHSALASCLFAGYRQGGAPALGAASLYEISEAVRLSPTDAYYEGRRAFVMGAVAEKAGGIERPGMFMESYRGYLKAIGLNPANPFNYMDAARLAVLSGRRDDAEGLLLKALSYEPDFLPARLELARSYIRGGRRAEARGELLKIKEAQVKYSADNYAILIKYSYQVDPSEVDRLLKGLEGA